MAAALATVALAACARGQDVPAAGSGVLFDWRPPPVAQVRSEALSWLESQKPDAALRVKAEALWRDVAETAPPLDVLERAVRTFALADGRAAALVDLAAGVERPLVLPPQPWLADPKTPRLVSANLRLWYGRWLAERTLFDEAQEQLDGLEPEDVIDPATLLFCQGVCHYCLLRAEPGLETLDRLREGAAVPRRYADVARLMEADLKGLEVDSLDHIARRMDDVRRRLDLGRAGKKVRAIEDGVIESLDKLIKELEERQRQQLAAAMRANSIKSSNPAQDSLPMGGSGPGEVTKRDIGSQSGWGNLPPKEREEAMQQIGRDFPSHYREVIEQYFRKMANESGE